MHIDIFFKTLKFYGMNYTNYLCKNNVNIVRLAYQTNVSYDININCKITRIRIIIVSVSFEYSVIKQFKTHLKCNPKNACRLAKTTIKKFFLLVFSFILTYNKISNYLIDMYLQIKKIFLRDVSLFVWMSDIFIYTYI